MSAPVYWLVDPEADAITSPFVRQPHYNDLESRVKVLEDAINLTLSGKAGYWPDVLRAALGSTPKKGTE